MALTTADYKRKFIRELLNRSKYIYTRQVDAIEFVTRCPFCGDSKSNSNTGHFYIRCDVSDNYSIVYNCFKCNLSGIVDKNVIEKLELTDNDLLSNIDSVNKNSPSLATLSKKTLMEGFREFDFILPKNKKHRRKLQYISDRLGFNITPEIESDIKVITSLKEFLTVNKIGTLTCKPFLAQKFEDNYIGFLSKGSSHILFRDVTETEKISWVKYPILPESVHNHVWYAMNGEVNLFSEDTIEINLSEGVMDTLSIAYNLQYYKPDGINIAICGKSYDRIINRLIAQGFYGSNVVINIFSDNDYKFNMKNRKNNYNTTLPYFKKSMVKYSLLFKEINIYYNILYKDYGTTRDNIVLEKHRL